MLLAQYFPGDWATLITSVPGSPFNGLTVELAPLGAKMASRGAVAGVAELHRRNGSTTNIYVIEGEFDANSIDPSDTWKSLRGAPFAIVSDVDESGTAKNGVGEAIARGCRTTPPSTIIALGTFQPVSCHDPYAKQVHITEVAEAYVVPNGATNSGEAPCDKQTLAISPETCVGQSVSDALADIFTDLYRHPNIHGIIIPAIGTGYGGLRKKLFYRYLEADISTALKRDLYLPDYIYLQVYRKDKAGWTTTSNAVSRALAALINDWNSEDHSTSDPGWTPIVGVLGGFGVLLLVVAIAPALISYEQLNLAILGSGSIIILLMGWLLSALGLASVVRPFLPANLVVEMVVGFLVGFLTGPILRALRILEARSPAKA
jgi:hypothetical protein